jgi:hypothetical protein
MACTTDSASNNDTLMSSLESTCQDKHINFTKKNNHIRCLAHVINLAVQDALSLLKVGYVEDEDEILNQNESTSDIIPKVKVKLSYCNFEINLLIINIFYFII